jgi:hypothetical protein
VYSLVGSHPHLPHPHLPHPHLPHPLRPSSRALRVVHGAKLSVHPWQRDPGVRGDRRVPMGTDEPEGFGEILQRFREAAGLSQEVPWMGHNYE